MWEIQQENLQEKKILKIIRRERIWNSLVVCLDEQLKILFYDKEKNNDEDEDDDDDDGDDEGDDDDMQQSKCVFCLKFGKSKNRKKDRKKR